MTAVRTYRAGESTAPRLWCDHSRCTVYLTAGSPDWETPQLRRAAAQDGWLVEQPTRFRSVVRWADYCPRHNTPGTVAS